MSTEDAGAPRAASGDRARVHDPPGEGLGGLRALALGVAIALVCAALYRGALTGPFIGDDQRYLTHHPYTAELSADNLRAIVDPTSGADAYTVNYAPLHLVLCALERHFFGTAPLPYHLVNVALHALNAVLLLALLLESGVPRAGAGVGALAFALHPANVEAVAWISQLKTLAAFALAAGALLALWRRPAFATVLYTLALLTKFLALPVLFAALAFAWCRPERSRRHHTFRWLAGWALLSALVAVPQLAAFGYGGSVDAEAFRDAGTQLRTMAAIGARYLAMAGTTWGLSAFHEPPAAASWTDRWWLLSLPLAAALLWRLASTLRRRDEEGAWWVLAAASFAPVSQIVPFFYPMGDRYLYFILPGLLGGALGTGAALHRRLAARLLNGSAPRRLGRLALVASFVGLAFFGVRSSARAAIWQGLARVERDAARHYPAGSTAWYLRAVQAAQRGEPERAVQALRAAEAVRPISLVRTLTGDPQLAPLFGEPAFLAFVREVAGYRIELGRRHGYDHPGWLRTLASAHAVRGEYDEAIEALERAIRAGGPLRPALLEDLAKVRERRRRARASARPDG